MKKILLTLGLAVTASLSYAQRSIDWSVEQIVAPTQLNSTSGGTSFMYDIVVKNNGTDSVYTTDTIGLQILCTVNDTTLVFAYPNAQQVVPRSVTRTLAPGDTMHLTGALNVNLVAKLSFNCKFIAYSVVFNRTANGIFNETTSTTNNAIITDMVWYNQQGWGVSVNEMKINEVSLYPNPSTDFVKISSNLIDISANSEITITDMMGRIVYHEMVDASAEVVVSTSDLEAGVYHVNVKNGSLNNSGKLIIR